MKKILSISLAALALCLLTYSCVKEKDFDDRVTDIVNAQLVTLNTKVDSLSRVQTMLNQSLKSIKGDVEKLSKQSTALSQSLDALKDSLAAQKEWTLEQLDVIDGRITAVETEQAVFMAEVYNRLGRLEARIQGIEVVPEYQDGSVGVKKTSTVTISFEVRPASLVDSIVKEMGASAFILQAVETKAVTKAATFVDLSVSNPTVGPDSLLTLTVGRGSLPNEFFVGTKCFSARLRISDGNTDKNSAFFPLIPMAPVYPSAPSLPCVKIENTWWAPVNCGYADLLLPYGLIYQWGRKWGQCYDEAYPPIELERITESLKVHPDKSDTCSNKFYYGLSSGIWYYGADMKSLWNGTSKGEYDPCPEGWRVPTEAEITALIANKVWGTATIGGTTQSGYWFNGSSEAAQGKGVFLPTAGIREHTLGRASERDTVGYYWSSPSNGSSARFLRIRSTETHIGDGALELGRSVRCVEE